MIVTLEDSLTVGLRDGHLLVRDYDVLGGMLQVVETHRFLADDFLRQAAEALEACFGEIRSGGATDETWTIARALAP